MNDIKESIISKLNKLKALAGNNPSEHERAAAMDKMNALMSEHGIEQAELGAKQEEVTQESFTSKKVTWQGVIQYAVGQQYSVYLYYKRNAFGGDELHAVGLPTNIAAYKSVSDWLIETVENAATAAGYRGVRERNQFALGAAFALVRKIKQQTEEEKTRLVQGVSREEASKKLNQLMVIKTNLMQRNKEFLAKRGQSIGKGKAANARTTAANLHGQSVGASLSTNRQVTGQVVKRITQRD